MTLLEQLNELRAKQLNAISAELAIASDLFATVKQNHGAFFDQGLVTELVLASDLFVTAKQINGAFFESCLVTDIHSIPEDDRDDIESCKAFELTLSSGDVTYILNRGVEYYTYRHESLSLYSTVPNIILIHNQLLLDAQHLFV